MFVSGSVCVLCGNLCRVLRDALVIIIVVYNRDPQKGTPNVGEALNPISPLYIPYKPFGARRRV